MHIKRIPVQYSEHQKNTVQYSAHVKRDPYNTDTSKEYQYNTVHIKRIPVQYSAMEQNSFRPGQGKIVLEFFLIIFLN